jgi:carboxymethylenebutenolidase
MAQEAIELKTEDGTCGVQVFRPAGTGPHPAAVMFQDAFGVRPALFEIAERVAAAGFYVMLPDLFYRTGYKSPGFGLFADPVARADFMTRIAPTVAAAPIMRDMKAFLAHLDAQSAVRGEAIGVFGYCLGGRLALVAAGSSPERVAAAAAYHPGFVATDAPDSPHLLAPSIEGKVYIGRAMEDASFDDAAKEKLDRALDEGEVDYRIEDYAARHGWVPRDSPAHDEAAAKRHWDTLLPLLRETLQK